MKDILKNMMYAGIGAAFLTREKLEELRKELMDKGCLSVEEGKAFVDELLKKSEAAKGNLEQWITRQVEEKVKQCHLASTEDVAALRSQVEELQAMVRKEQGCGSQHDCGTSA